MSKVGVIGSGVMGLAAAYHALKAGHSVEVFEAAAGPGGMAAHFDFEGLSIERFYHFICKSDDGTFGLLRDLGIDDRLCWKDTSMGYFYGGRLHPWGDPISLLRFPGLGLWSKLRYGAQMFWATRRKNWRPLDRVSARDWFVSGSGRAAYELLWEPLMRLKFHQHADRISAAWIWCRIKRLGRSRRSIFQETLGYLEGGSETLVEALVAAIDRLGGRVHFSCASEEVKCDAGRVVGIATAQGFHACEQVISTVPTPLIPGLVPGLSDEAKARYAAIRNIGVVCVVLKLARPVSPHFWINVSDPDIDIPGLVEFSNLRPLPATIVYVPYYMPTSHPKFLRSDEVFIDECLDYLQVINPNIAPGDLLAARVGRLRYSQPICEVGFADMVPPVQTEIAGLQVADTCFYYPEDRGISESVSLGRRMAAALPPVDR